MLTKMVLTLFACIGVTAGAILAAPSQDRPGVATQARVWVENRAPNEAELTQYVIEWGLAHLSIFRL